MPPATDTARFLGGFVAAEGCFTRTPDPGHFSFAVGLGATDTVMCDLLAEFLGVGTVHRRGRRQPHYDDEVTFQVRKLADLVHILVPFMDAHLPPSSKRGQFESWRAELLTYWEHSARRRRPCTVEGCDLACRAYGLCRRHLYQERGV